MVEKDAVGSIIERALAEVADLDSPVHRTDARFLDAALELFSAQGIARTTMEDIARRAGMSRITVYRRLSSKEALVEQVLLREFRRYLVQFAEDVAGARTVEDRVVTGFVSATRAVRSNALIRGLVANDKDLFASSLVGEDGHTMAVVSRFVGAQLRGEQAAGHVGAEIDVDRVGELMVRIAASLLLTPSEQIDVDDDDQLADLARHFLLPMLGL
jgi:AcrR family transcriptional regulator